MKNLLCNIIEKNRSEIVNIGENIFTNPELGFKEFKTSKVIVDYLSNMGLSFEDNISVTGIKSTIGDKGINIGLIAELDAVPTNGHKYASNDSSAAHACAHSNQVAIMLGVIKALKESRVLDELNGRVTFIGTPAEEFTDFEYRRELIRTGKIKYMSGKQDMIAKGIFDDVDLIISCHTMGGIKEKKADINSSLNGFISKKVTYYGKAAHAGAAPHLGINALNAAVIGLAAVNAQRETFIDEHNIRVHGIIKEGGQTVNTIPERVVIEAYIRGRNLGSILDANYKVDRAFKAGAYAVGGRCLIEDTPGYVPFIQCSDLSEVLKANLSNLIGEENIINGQNSMASGDIGDLSTIKPTIQFGFSGFSGNVHGPDFEIADKEMAYIIPAKAIAMAIVDLLENNGTKGKRIIENNPSIYTKEEYIKKWLENMSLNAGKILME